MKKDPGIACFGVDWRRLKKFMNTRLNFSKIYTKNRLIIIDNSYDVHLSIQNINLK